MPSLAAVTSPRKLETTVLDNGQILNVIDTPGLFDSAEMVKEIAKCISMAKDGIHAFLLVLTPRILFWEEEASAFESLCQIFGDYIIVVFTHGDCALKDHECNNFSELLNTTKKMCGNRVVVIDNKAEDEVQISRKQLLFAVEAVVKRNGGKPYTNDLFDVLKVESSLKESILEKQLAEERVARVEAEVKALALQTKSKDEAESRLKESIHNLEKQLAKERAARMEAEMKASSLQTKSKDEVLELKECLDRAEESRKQLEERLHRVESIHNLEKQLAEERAARMEAEMKVLTLQTKSKDEVLELKKCLNRAEESRKHLEERLHRVESIHNLEKQLAEERAARMEAEMKVLTLQTKSKDEVLELKKCLNRAEESRKHLEERLHRVESIHNLEKQLAEERAARMEAEMEALSIQSKSKDDVLELKECLDRAEESRKQLEERLHRVESIPNLEKQLAKERAARMEAEMKVLSLQTKSKDGILELKECLTRAEESRKQLEERLHRVESIHNLKKQLAEERAARMEAEMKALSFQTKSKNDVLELKECLNRAEESRKQLEERLHKAESIHNLEKQLAEERAARMEAEMKATKSKNDVLELKECLDRAERKQLKERLRRAESQIRDEPFTGPDNTAKTLRKGSAIQVTTDYLPRGRRGKLPKSFKGFGVGKKKWKW